MTKVIRVSIFGSLECYERKQAEVLTMKTNDLELLEPTKKMGQGLPILSL